MKAAQLKSKEMSMPRWLEASSFEWSILTCMRTEGLSFSPAHRSTRALIRFEPVINFRNGEQPVFVIYLKQEEYKTIIHLYRQLTGQVRNYNS